MDMWETRVRIRDIWESLEWIDQAKLCHVWGAGGEGRGEPGPVARRPKDQKGRVTKTSIVHRKELLREGQSSPWIGEFRVEDKACEPYRVIGRD